MDTGDYVIIVNAAQIKASDGGILRVVSRASSELRNELRALTGILTVCSSHNTAQKAPMSHSRAGA